MSREDKRQVCVKNSRKKEVVGLPGIEPGTSRLSGVRSNRLSYKPTRLVLKRRGVRENTVALSLSKSRVGTTNRFVAPLSKPCVRLSPHTAFPVNNND